MKTTATSVLAALAALCALNSCQDKGKASDLVSLRSYSYDGIAVINPDSTVPGDVPAYVRTTGRGVMPVAIGRNDITALRDTLQKLAAVNVTADGVAVPRGAAEYTPVPGDTAITNADSFVETDLSVALVTPAVVVWKNYAEGYTAGAAHGRYGNTYINYSVADNKILTVADLFREDAGGELLAAVRGKLADNEDLIVPADEAPMPNNFEITADGVNFVYGIYEVAPYSSGEVTVGFTYYELADMLKPRVMEMLSPSQQDE